MFQRVDRQPSFPALEERVLARWRERGIVERSLGAHPDGPLWRVYEGPPTANGPPGAHHVLARTVKDVFPRYRTMKGYRVPRQAGWDCHGIPVEVQVERELGFDRKRDIEAFGVGRFNALCRASVTRHVDAWAALTERIGYWVDLDDAYWTMSPGYVDSVWWSLKTLWDRGLLAERLKVVPYCPRCGTTLSDHEVAQGYADVDDPSAYVRFPVTGGPLADEDASLLVWTTTPWTLFANAAVAVNPGQRYVLADAGEPHGRVVLARDRLAAVLGTGARVVRDVATAELLGARYSAPFDVSPAAGAGDGRDAGAWRSVVPAAFVTAAEGTGLVHVAPAFGADDLALATEHGLPVVDPVDAEGTFTAQVAGFAGRFVKDADDGIMRALAARGVLLAGGTYRHAYPHCWRCDTPLLYRARPAWHVETTRARERMLEVNAGVDWHPEHVRDGRFGNWLRGGVDWALSRERYWGTPLPLWRCEACGHVTAVGSRAELGRLAGRDLGALDPHRPYVDEIVVACRACDGTARRVPEVIDAWYDSGAMPFARFGYPHAAGSDERLAEGFPAQFVSEGLDQTRGWFYSLLAISTLLFDRGSYETALCLGLVVDDSGRKMSTSRGNAADPWEIIGTHGADALRWRLLARGSPWGEQRVSSELAGEVVRRFLLTLWNTYAFLVTYARLDGWVPAAVTAPPPGERPVMDRWVLAELAGTVARVDAALEAYDATSAGREIERFVDGLSNWYVRRSRARFWSQAPAGDPDKAAAYATLHACLVEVAKLLAPFTPFLADELFENLVRAVDPAAPDSVHLCDFPVSDGGADDPRLRAAMQRARRVVELGRRARDEAGVAVRQPLRAAHVVLPAGEGAGWDEVAGVVAEELNVKAVERPDGVGQLVARRLAPEFGALGPAFGDRTPAVARAIASADAGRVAAELARTGTARVGAGTGFTVTAEQVRVLEEPRTGWHVVTDGRYTVAVNLSLDDELRAEGRAREFARAVNELRKRMGLDLDERIAVTVDAGGEAAAALAAHRDWIAGQVLAARWDVAPVTDGARVRLGDGLEVVVRVDRLA